MSDVEVHLIETTVRGRYLLRPAAGDPVGLLVGFHGYGETAASHLAALLEIPGVESWTVASIQGLHPFYTRSGDVVASWMTKLDREEAIEDNLAYVRAAVAEILAAAGAGHLCDGLIALAGDVPPELAELDLGGFPPVLIGRGTGDSWYSEEKLTDDVLLLREKGIQVEFERFEGGHEWTAVFHRQCAAMLSGLSSGSEA